MTRHRRSCGGIELFTGLAMLAVLMLVPVCVTDDHEIIPRPGSARRARDGQPADLTRPSDYPVTATCLNCGQPIRAERWLLSEWYHVETEPGSD